MLVSSELELPLQVSGVLTFAFTHTLVMSTSALRCGLWHPMRMCVLLCLYAAGAMVRLLGSITPISTRNPKCSMHYPMSEYVNIRPKEGECIPPQCIGGTSGHPCRFVSLSDPFSGVFVRAEGGAASLRLYSLVLFSVSAFRALLCKR